MRYYVPIRIEWPYKEKPATENYKKDTFALHCTAQIGIRCIVLLCKYFALVLHFCIFVQKNCALVML